MDITQRHKCIEERHYNIQSLIKEDKEMRFFIPIEFNDNNPPSLRNKSQNLDNYEILNFIPKNNSVVEYHNHEDSITFSTLSYDRSAPELLKNQLIYKISDIKYNYSHMCFNFQSDKQLNKMKIKVSDPIRLNDNKFPFRNLVSDRKRLNISDLGNETLCKPILEISSMSKSTFKKVEEYLGCYEGNGNYQICMEDNNTLENYLITDQPEPKVFSLINRDTWKEIEVTQIESFNFLGMGLTKSKNNQKIDKFNSSGYDISVSNIFKSFVLFISYNLLLLLVVQLIFLCVFSYHFVKFNNPMCSNNDSLKHESSFYNQFSNNSHKSSIKLLSGSKYEVIYHRNLQKYKNK